MLWTLIIGLVSGWLAGMISRGGGFGILGNLVIGVIGSFVGGFVFSLIGITTYGIIGSIISSTIGAIVLLWVTRMFHVAAPAHKKE